MGDIDEVKARTNIIDVIGARVTLKKAGRHWKALCPFHNEKTPSFIVSPERESWKCFGCGKGGSVIDFVMEYEHVDFVEALETLAEKAGIKLERRHPDTPEAKLKEKIFAANHLTSEFYHFLLTKHAVGEKARIYLKTRGVTDKTIKTFSLGYSPNSWDGLLKYLKKKGYDEAILDQAGLIVPSRRGGYDRFRGRVMFTLKDHRGNIVGFSGRLLDPEAKDPPSLKASEGQAPKYINTSETLVYSKSNVLYGLDVTKSAIQKEGEAIVMEGEFDVISSFQAGVANAVAIKGSALTEGHVNLLRRFADRLTLALDSDPAGDAAARRGIEIADRAGLDLRIAVMPTGKDPDEAARESPGPFKKALKAATPIYDYFIASATARYDVNDTFGKRKVSDELLPVIAKIDNSIVQGHYVKKLATTLGVSEDAINDGMRKLIRTQGVGRKVEGIGREEPKKGRGREENLELYVLAILLQGKTIELYEEFKETLSPADLTIQPVRQILAHLEQYLKDHSIFLIKDFADRLPKELTPTLDEAFLWDIADLIDDEERWSEQWDKTLRELKRTVLRRQIRELTKQLAVSEELSADKESAIQGQLRDLTTHLKDLEKGA
ncbi:DNA primase [Candidatus Gottesmanbacteria bacterium]|nr:DNA primase [Candidatus Gottesmanbacteria bacterium]